MKDHHPASGVTGRDPRVVEVLGDAQQRLGPRRGMTSVLGLHSHVLQPTPDVARSPGRAGHAAGAVSVLATPRRAVADVLDLGAEAAGSLGSVTAIALAGLLWPASPATVQSWPDPAAGSSPSSEFPLAGSPFARSPLVGPAREGAPPPVGDSTRPGRDFPAMSAPSSARTHVEPTHSGASLLERSTVTVAALILDAAALALGAVAVITTPVESAAQLLTRSLPRRSTDTPDPVPAAVRAAGHAHDAAAAARHGHGAATSAPTRLTIVRLDERVHDGAHEPR